MSDRKLRAWVEEVAAQTRPDSIHVCDGSQAEIDRLHESMVADGSLIRLNEEKHPNSFYARSDPNDVARVEGRTYICSDNEADAGPTNNSMSPAKMHELLDVLFDGYMRGRVMYVVPYVMGPPGSRFSKVGVEITDSPYVVANMRIMTRMGQVALDELGKDGDFVKGLHCTGNLDPEHRYIAHFPDENLVESINSNYGGNALLGKKCFALRLASVLARNEGWLAEHMLILGMTDPSGNKTYIAAAFPSACGKTNLAMLVPPERDRDAGWKIETVGDDIAWMRFGPDGRLYAVNPEAGFFGVAPGTSMATNPNALLACRANTIFTNVALRPDRTVWWEGLDGPKPPSCLDWKGNPWTPESRTPAAHPNSRFTAPAAQCPCISPEWENPNGVPISAIVFGGRRSTTMPLVYQAFNWQHGTYIGATLSSQRTAAVVGKVGEVRFDPMAMLPFCGYHMGDYWQHWLNTGRRGGNKMPAIFHVNWFRKEDSGPWLWPGYGANLRVLAWIAERAHGEADAVETPIGYLPTPTAINTDGLGVDADTMAQLLEVDTDHWMTEVNQRASFFEKFGGKLPPALADENAALRRRLARRQPIAESFSAVEKVKEAQRIDRDAGTH
ncbi:MAG: phosphoenolpyruvate carboxykinase (GTP) [Planctomycetaceae bacterium]